jgi:DNA-binding transcriptional MerR regulator
MSDETSRGALPAKLYFRIGEVAGLVGVEPHVLRYWEREFRSIRPSKSAKGQRVYSRRDVENLLRVRDLLYGQGFTIAGARKRMRDKDPLPGVEPETTPEAAPAPSAYRVDPVAEPAPSIPPVALAPSRAVHAAPEARGAVAVESRVNLVAPHAGHDRVREQLEELKTEIEAFLEELGT